MQLDGYGFEIWALGLGYEQGRDTMDAMLSMLLSSELIEGLSMD